MEPEPARDRPKRKRKRGRRGKGHKKWPDYTPNSGDPTKPDYKPRRDEPILADGQDLKIWAELNDNPQWQIPERAYNEAPEALLNMFANPELKPGTRIQAMNTLQRLAAANGASKKHQSSMQFNVHKYYQSRHSHAETPEAEAGPIDALSFREQTTNDESVELLEELDQLGLMQLFIKGE